MQNWLEIGKIVRTHGIKGAVKIISYLDDVNFSIFKTVYLGANKQKAIIKKVLPLNGGAFSVVLDVAPDIDTAEKLKNVTVYIDREEYSQFQDKVYLSDLINCPVLDENGEQLGVLIDFNDYGASTVLEIKCGIVTYSFPYVEEYIKYDNSLNAFVTTKQIFKDMRV